ncbi:MAG: metallophosphoesterase family protein [Thermotogota bacterium]
MLLAQRRLIRLDPKRETVFVGDTHGDLDATEEVLARYSSPDAAIVFLGDVVDRGPQSRENLARILAAVAADSERTILLMGNHEAWDIARFSPADFWDSLPSDEEPTVARVLRSLPLAAWHPAGVLALHGALPDLRSLESINAVDLGSPAWRDITWGDWRDVVRVDGRAGFTGRPTYGADVFRERSRHLGVRVLVRSHQPDAPTYLFGDRCLTLFTSSAYGDGRRHVAVLSWNVQVGTARDLALAEVRSCSRGRGPIP